MRARFALAVFGLIGIVTPLTAVTEQRNFIPVDLASVRDGNVTAQPIPVGGLQLFLTRDAVTNTRHLQFTVDLQRIGSVDEGAGLQPAVQGQTFELVASNAQFPAMFEHLWSSSLQQVLVDGVTHVIVPYGVTQGSVESLFYADVIVDLPHHSATIASRQTDTQQLVTPGSAIAVVDAGDGTGARIVFTHPEPGGDAIAIYNPQTSSIVYTALNGGPRVSMVAGGSTGLIAFAGASAPIEPASIRFNTVANLEAGAALLTGPALDNESKLWATDGAWIFYGRQAVPAAPYVLTAFNPARGTTISTSATMVMTAGVSRAEGGIVAFATREADQRDGQTGLETDFNGDGDYADTQLQFYDANTDTVVTTQLTLEDITEGLPESTWARPASDGRIVTWGHVPYPIDFGVLTNLKLIRLPGVVGDCPDGTTLDPDVGSCVSTDVTPPIIDVPVEGHMRGEGTVANSTATARFDFNVREWEPNGERGRIALEINYTAKRKKNDTFKSRTVTSVVFSDDPGFTPGKTAKPTVDSVAFSGVGFFNGVDGYAYTAKATDRGEPGRLVDTLDITIHAPNGATVATFSGVIQTGNIQSLRLSNR